MSIETTTPGSARDNLLRREQAKAVFDLLRSIRRPDTSGSSDR
ncbi:MAG: hypothetical protein AB7V58_06300 [Solirubrobacterales bacterium]